MNLGEFEAILIFIEFNFSFNVIINKLMIIFIFVENNLFLIIQ